MFGVGLYSVVCITELWLGFPALEAGLFVGPFALAALVLPVLFRRHVVVLLVCFVGYVVSPALGSLGLGFVRYANLDQTIALDGLTSGPIEQAAPQPLLMHISDTHFVALSRCKPSCRTYEGARWKPSVIEQLATHAVRLRPRYLLITGDVTDTGATADWVRAEEMLLGPARRAGITVVLAPGTHDLQSVFSDELPAWAPVGMGEALLERRFLTATELDLHTVDRESVRHLLATGRRPEDVLAEYQKEVRSCIELCRAVVEARSCTQGCGDAVNRDSSLKAAFQKTTIRACRNWFPLIHYDHDTRMAVLVLCSSGEPTSKLFNVAIGSFGAEQLARFEIALERLPAETRYVAVLLHHTPARPADDLFAWPKRWWPYSQISSSPAFTYSFLGADWHESISVIRTLRIAVKANHSRVFILLYGHRHSRHLGSVDPRVITSEAPAAYEGGEAIGLCYETRELGRLRCGWARL